MAINNPCPRALPSDSGSLWTINPWLPRFIYYLGVRLAHFDAVSPMNYYSILHGISLFLSCAAIQYTFYIAHMETELKSH